MKNNNIRLGVIVATFLLLLVTWALQTPSLARAEDCTSDSDCGGQQYCANKNARGIGTCKYKETTPKPTGGYTCTAANCPAPGFYCYNSTTCLASSGYCGGKACDGECVTSGMVGKSTCSPAAPCCKIAPPAEACLGSCKALCNGSTEDVNGHIGCTSPNFCCVPKASPPDGVCPGSCKALCNGDTEISESRDGCTSPNFCCVPKTPPAEVCAGSCKSLCNGATETVNGHVGCTDPNFCCVPKTPPGEVCTGSCKALCNGSTEDVNGHIGCTSPNFCCVPKTPPKGEWCGNTCEAGTCCQCDRRDPVTKNCISNPYCGECSNPGVDIITCGRDTCDAAKEVCCPSGCKDKDDGCGGGTCTDTSWSPAPTNTCDTATLEQTSNCGTKRTVEGTKDCAVVAACMEMKIYKKNADGTYGTTPLTAAELNAIKINDSLRLTIKGSHANLKARFKVIFNNVAMFLPGPVVWADAPNQRPATGFTDPNTKLISYYDFIATRSGTYKYEGYVSTKP